MFKGENVIRRTIGMLSSVIIMGFGIAILMYCDVGVDPLSTLNLGFSNLFNISYGNCQAIFNTLLLLVVICFERKMLGIGTLGNMFLIGYSADFFTMPINNILPAVDEISFIMKMALTVLSVAIILVTCSLHIVSGLGIGPNDAVSYLVPNRTKIHFSLWRFSMDITYVTVGYLLGATVGLGTILIALSIGPLLPFCNKYISAPLLGVKWEEKKSEPVEELVADSTMTADEQVIEQAEIIEE